MDINEMKEKLQAEYQKNKSHGWLTGTSEIIGISDQVLTGILKGTMRGEFRTWQLIEKYLKDKGVE